MMDSSDTLHAKTTLSTDTQTSEQTVLPDSLKSDIEHWIAKYPAAHKQSALVPALLTAQKYYQGWLPVTVIQSVADYLKIPPIIAYEVATFYSMLELAPVGRNLICVCTNVSCMLNGSDSISQYLSERLKLRFGETSEDKCFTLKEVECLGACTNAPIITVNGTYHENVTEEKIEKLLTNLEK